MKFTIYNSFLTFLVHLQKTDKPYFRKRRWSKRRERRTQWRLDSLTGSGYNTRTTPLLDKGTCLVCSLRFTRNIQIRILGGFLPSETHFLSVAKVMAKKIIKAPNKDDNSIGSLCRMSACKMKLSKMSPVRTRETGPASSIFKARLTKYWPMRPPKALIIVKVHSSVVLGHRALCSFK